MDKDKLKKIIFDCLDTGLLTRAIFSSPKAKDQPQKIIARPLLIKGRPSYQLSYHYATQVVHKNVLSHEFNPIFEELTKSFKQILLSTPEQDYHILMNKNGDPTILKKPSTNPKLSVQSHNRVKNYILQEGTPIPFLVGLGVMSPSGKVFSEKRDKFRQINRFLEMIDDILPFLDNRKTLRIVDFGCGKAYLTFALYHYLKEKKYDLQIIGLDLKAEVIETCQGIADKLHYHQLKFLKGDINLYTTTDPVDVVVCLHACDTATDAAIEKAVHWGTRVLLVVPCCQHELFKQVQCESLAPLLSHGILKERFAALVTDAARAHILEILGYKTQILEFIDLEHTPKNLLIRAVLQSHPRHKGELIEKYRAFKETLHIQPDLERRFLDKLIS
ncbi:MAG: SAM-dependent methyltransferase [Chlamydiales bacterium 38-26]|nr:SAM-dependent methyltransferase [Chlamydiales bacterium]OJV11344.1 MAG: SAM-dependent methyltransferase [Chlamydiales bacterium 38-26]